MPIPSARQVLLAAILPRTTMPLAEWHRFFARQLALYWDLVGDGGKAPLPTGKHDDPCAVYAAMPAPRRCTRHPPSPAAYPRGLNGSPGWGAGCKAAPWSATATAAVGATMRALIITLKQGLRATYNKVRYGSAIVSFRFGRWQVGQGLTHSGIITASPPMHVCTVLDGCILGLTP